MRFLCALIGLTFAFQINAKINIGVTQWSGLTNADGSGVYLELLRNVYAEQDVNFDFTSYKRLSRLFERSNHDLVVGVYREDVPSAYYANWHLDYDSPVRAFFLKDKFKINHLSDLKGLTLSWINGYDFNNFIEYNHQTYPVNSIDNGINMLINGRTHVFIDYQRNIPLELTDQFDSIEILPARPLYLAFKNTQKGRMLASLFDKNMEQLRNSGELQTIFTDRYINAKFANFRSDLPNIIISSNDESIFRLPNDNQILSLEAKVYSMLLAKLSQYNIVFIKSSAEGPNAKVTPASCFANMIYTKTRAQTFIYSKPFSFYLAPRAYSLKPLPTKLPQTFSQFISQHNLRLGLPAAQAFDSEVADVIKNIPVDNKVDAPPHVFDRLQALAKQTNFTLSLEYPADISSYWPLITDKKLYSLPITKQDTYTLGHMMCKKNEANQKFVKHFNDELTRLYKTQEFFKVIENSAVGVDKKQLKQLTNAAFIDNE